LKKSGIDGSVVNDAISLSTTKRPLVIIGAVQAVHHDDMSLGQTARLVYHSITSVKDRYSWEILSTAAQLYEKSPLKRIAVCE